MDPITAIAVAKGLATFVPSLMKMFGAKEPTVEVATRVVEMASAVTGAKTPQEALEILNMNTEKQMEFQRAVMENERLLQDAYLRDTQDARARDVALAVAGRENKRANVLVALAYSLVIACLAIAVLFADTSEFIKVTISLILGRALGWVDQVMNFDFGTNRSSATKDDTINSLANK